MTEVTLENLLVLSELSIVGYEIKPYSKIEAILEDGTAILISVESIKTLAERVAEIDANLQMLATKTEELTAMKDELVASAPK